MTGSEYSLAGIRDAAKAWMSARSADDEVEMVWQKMTKNGANGVRRTDLWLGL